MKKILARADLKERLFIYLLPVVLGLIQWLVFRPLELDESWIGLNLLDRDYAELLKPLAYNQVAPIAFLWILKFLGEHFHYADWALRLYSLVLFPPSVWLVYAFFKSLTGKKTAFITALLFSLNLTVLYYSVEVKQYLGDIFFFYLILWLARKTNQTGGPLIFTGLWIAGIIAPWFSNVSVFAMAVAGLYLLYYARMNVFPRKRLIMLVLGWVISFGIYYWFFIRNHPTREFMIRYWEQWHAFLNLKNPPAFLKTFMYVVSKNALQFTGLFKYLGLLVFAGIFALWREKKYEVLYWTAMPVFLHVWASALKMYPFQVRMTLYLFPVFIFWFVYAINYFFKKYGYTIFIGLIVYFLVVLFKSFPYKKGEHVYKINQFVTNKSSSQTIYISKLLFYPVKYYQKTGRLDFDAHVSMHFFDFRFKPTHLKEGDIIVLFDNGKPQYTSLKEKIRNYVHENKFQVSDSIRDGRMLIYLIEKE